MIGRYRGFILPLLVVIITAGRCVAAQQSITALEAAARSAEAAGNLREALSLYVRAFQSLPGERRLEDDVRIREHAISVAQRLEPKPVGSGDTDRFTVRGKLTFDEAKGREGFESARAEFQKAVNAAPWDPATAYNLALVDEKLEYYRAAVANIKLYLQTNPPDGTSIQPKVYELELKSERASPAAADREFCAVIDPAECAERARLKREAADSARREAAETRRAALASIGRQPNDPAILVCVIPLYESGDLLNSVKDLLKQLDGKKEVVLVRSREAADILLVVTKRETIGGDPRVYWVYADLQFGPETKSLSAGYSGGSFRHLWTADAEDIAKDALEWIAKNRTRILARRSGVEKP